MVRELVLVACALSLAACGSSSSEVRADDPQDAGMDASPAPIEDDDEPAGPRSIQVENAGDACEGTEDCRGPGAMCLTTFAPPMGFGGPGGGQGMAITFPDGYCTASCQSNDECAAGSKCGVIDLFNTLQPILQAQGGAIANLDPSTLPSQCLELCSDTPNCRRGYVCQSLLDALGFGNMTGGFPIPFISKYCLPDPNPPTNMDAGSDPEPPMDAGHTAPGDAGQGDASTPNDASTPDDASTPNDASVPSDADTAPADAGSAPEDAGNTSV